MHPLYDIHAQLCDMVGTPVALAAKAAMATGEWATLKALAVNPSSYSDSESYFYDNLCVDLLRKADIPGQKPQKKKIAVETFYLCERQNAETNARIDPWIHNIVNHDADSRVLDFVVEWRKEINDVLKGHFPNTLVPRFSRGSTFADVGKLTTIPDKMTSQPTVTGSAFCLDPLWSETAWSRGLIQDFPERSQPRLVRGNIFFTVPKDWEKDRGCCREPSINITYQLDVAQALRRALKAYGIDLSDGQDLHRQAAQKASDGTLDLATIDMSNASDTLCRKLPKLVLPSLWFLLLNSLRSPITRMPDGSEVYLEKFSSMGNGFTFELETLVFCTLSRTIARLRGVDPSSIICYGDDLIVPRQIVKDVLAALRLFGFTPNSKKTFYEGVFRESCGGDFFDGTPVRGVYTKVLPDEPQEWISLANTLRSRLMTGPEDSIGRYCRWERLKRVWFLIINQIPSSVRKCRGPESMGDLVIHDDESRWGSDPLRISVYEPVGTYIDWKYFTPGVQLASCLIGVSSRGPSPRNGVSGYKVKKVPRLFNNWLPIYG